MRLQTLNTYLTHFTTALRHPGQTLGLLVKAYRLWKIGGYTAIALRLKAFNQRPLDQAELWQQYRDTVNRTTFSRLAQRLRNTGARRLAIVLVIHHTAPVEWLSQTIQAVIEQIYPHWELGIVADGSTSPQVQQVLAAFARQDARIRVQFLLPQSELNLASNTSGAGISGEFILFMRDDHLLEKQALLRVAEAIVADQPDIIFADEAVVAADGATLRSLIWRPAFSLEYFRGYPEIARPLGFSTAFLKTIGEEEATLTLVQDDDFWRRAVESASCIVHIPEILTLTRTVMEQIGPTELALDKAALTHPFAQPHQENTRVKNDWFNFFAPPDALTADLNVAIIIPSRNCGDLVKTCIESLKSTIDRVHYDIVLVDHASDDPKSLAYFQAIAQHCKVLRYDGVFNFSVINNWAIAQLDDRYSHYLFCNNDIEAITAGWLERMLALAQQADIGIVGAKLLYPDRLIQHAGMVIGLKGASEHIARFMPAYRPDRSLEPGYLGALVVNREVSAVTAACLLMRRDAFEAVQGYDEGFVVGFGDTDLCLRTQQAGYRVIFCGHATLIHHESYTRGKSDGGRDPHPQDSARFIARWKDLLKTGDPYYNPNLSHFSCDWAVKSPLTLNDPIQRRVYRQP